MIQKLCRKDNTYAKFTAFLDDVFQNGDAALHDVIGFIYQDHLPQLTVDIALRSGHQLAMGCIEHLRVEQLQGDGNNKMLDRLCVTGQIYDNRVPQQLEQRDRLGRVGLKYLKEGQGVQRNSKGVAALGLAAGEVSFIDLGEGGGRRVPGERIIGDAAIFVCGKDRLNQGVLLNGTKAIDLGQCVREGHGGMNMKLRLALEAHERERVKGELVQLQHTGTGSLHKVRIIFVVVSLVIEDQNSQIAAGMEILLLLSAKLGDH